jgi:hypothetical protein
MKLIKNVIQFVLCNSSKCHYLEPLKKGVIAKMVYLVEFWFILESDLVERAPQKIFDELIKFFTQNTTDCTLTNTFFLTEFGSVMKKL